MLVLDIIVVALIVLVVLVSRVGMVVTAVAPHSCYGTHISNVDSVGTNLMAYRVIVVEVARMEILILMLKQNEATHLVVVFFPAEGVGYRYRMLSVRSLFVMVPLPVCQ